MGCAASTTAITTEEEAVRWFMADPDRRCVIHAMAKMDKSLDLVAEAKSKTELGLFYTSSTDVIALSTLAFPNIETVRMQSMCVSKDGPSKQSYLHAPFERCGQRGHNVTRVEIVECKDTPSSAIASFFAALPNPHQLEYVTLESSSRMDDAVLDALVDGGATKLTRFNANHCRDVTGDGLSRLVKSCPMLTELHVGGCQLNAAFFTAMAEHRLKHLRHFTIGDSDVTSSDDLAAFVKMMAKYDAQLDDLVADPTTKLTAAYREDARARARKPVRKPK